MDPEVYARLKSELLDDLRQVPEEDRQTVCFSCLCGQHFSGSINDIIREVENDTEAGREFVQMMADVTEFLEDGDNDDREPA